MADDGLREQIITALVTAAATTGSYRADALADALLPTVRQYAADVLREAAAAPWVWTTDGPAIPRYELERRAEALGRTEAET